MTSQPARLIDAHPQQAEIAEDKTRFKVAVTGRRWGKSILGDEVALYKAFNKHKSLNWIVCPTREMARDIHWDNLKTRCKDLDWKIKVNESNLSILNLETNSKIILKTADNPDRLRGRGLDFVCIDEFRDMDQSIWKDILRPALSDKKGEALFISTPNGHDILYDLYKLGQGNNPEWKSWHYKTIDSPFIESSEIEQARIDLDRLSFEREYEASFDTFGGRPYHAYSERNNLIQEIRYDLPFILTCDFNATLKPMSWALGQAWKNDKVSNTYWHKCFSNKFTNTQTQCEIVHEYFETLKYYPKELWLYGDYSSKKETSNSVYSDWEIIQNYFRNKVTNIQLKIKKCMSIRNSITATNIRLCNMIGEIRQFVNPEQCKELIEDWNKCEWKPNGRELDDSNDDRTHMCRAVDYYNDYEHPYRADSKITITNAA